jgi:hypothetical protein
LRSKIEFEEELILEIVSDEAVSCDSEGEHDEGSVAVDVTVMGLEAEIKFGQDHNIHGCLVVPILTLELSVD